MKRKGLYDPQNEHDSCGVGFVASIEGVASHKIVSWALQCVCNVTHRGAVSADAKTGDGAGILTQIPVALFSKVLKDMKVSPVPVGDLAIGMIFLGRGQGRQSLAVKVIEDSIKKQGINIIGWRKVPVDESVLGDKALDTRPDIRQVLLSRPSSISLDSFERKLFLIRRQIEKIFQKEGFEDFYIPSFSSKTIAYKGLLVAPQLKSFYKDLANPDYESSLAIFHQRYSTNTFPNWFLAQPFRFLAHNGEINTLRGNRNWMSAREPELSSSLWGNELKEILPIIQEEGSDSMSLDNAFELLLMSGRDALHSMMMLVPDAWQNMVEMEPEARSFYKYHAMLMEPWDGPAALAFTDGAIVGASLDRNGLRPARYWVTNENIVIMGSEVGIVDVPASQIIKKGRLGPGHLIAVDQARKELMTNEAIRREYSRRKPYSEWVEKSLFLIDGIKDCKAKEKEPAWESALLLKQQIAFGYTDEEISMILEPMAKHGKETVFSMGDDIPLAFLSNKTRPLFSYFKQLFAQVTNPPIDPIREELVMSLNSLLGARPNLLEQTQPAKRMILLQSPLLLPCELLGVQTQRDPDFKSATIPILFDSSKGSSELRKAIKEIQKASVDAIDQGASVLILSDRGVSSEKAAIPSLLATAAVHHHLIRSARRMKASLVVEAGDVHEVHQFACLLGYGAAAIYPYLAYQTIKSMIEAGRLGDVTFDKAILNYRKAIDQGVLKIMSKMGISTVGSYRGAQIFEAVGLSDEITQECFAGTPSRVDGITYEHIAHEALINHRKAFESDSSSLEIGGMYKYRRDGEYHAFNPEMVRLMQRSVRLGDYDSYKQFAKTVNDRPATALRDLLDIKPLGPAVDINEVEPIESIVARFNTASISYGALSIESHQTLAIAMNRLKAKSGSGEGGEAEERYNINDPNLNKNSAIKQIASGRFGVTPAYCVSAKELEIKMAQGSKPGEGGQLPGYKVSADIARTRHTIPGITLISPPPHHDIYSIEDLAQLIYDLKMVNPDAKVCVKLVSEAGVGTIAAGVAKGHADVILISGHDGGTGASPLSSIKNAGLPWELGLAETQQTLMMNGLREKVILRTDGGMKTARDVVLAALLGAEQYGFGTASLVASGCVMARQCHLNTCPVGIATQDSVLRERFKGTPEMVINYMIFIAQEVREILASIGAKKLNDVIGRSDLLAIRKRNDLSEKARSADLTSLIQSHEEGPRYHQMERNDIENDTPIDDQILKEASRSIDSQSKIKLAYEIRNTNRTVGARVAGYIAKRYGNKGLPDGTIDVSFTGTAGQSFGAFCINGMRLTLIGEANDYVGKAMAGGSISIRPPDDAGFIWSKNVIMGNTCLYGATGGYLFAAGRAGERFAVRNSGSISVVEGVGDHGCEYMTGGIALILGPTGRNFGAGMTGGRAYILDMERKFEKRINTELVRVELLEASEDIEIVRALIERHFVSTKSGLAIEILTNWDEYQPRFLVVVPIGAGSSLDAAVIAKEG